jgi:hypothetical protein
MAVVFVEARPKGGNKDSQVQDYVVEDHADNVMQHFQPKMMRSSGRLKTATNRTWHVRRLNDKIKPDCWRAV